MTDTLRQARLSEFCGREFERLVEAKFEEQTRTQSRNTAMPGGSNT
jgi:hypothetical protein